MINLETKYKILTWNILASHNYIERLPQIAEYVANTNADIVLLQETDDDFIDETVQAFAKYDYVMKVKSGRTSAGSSSGVAVGYNKHTFLEVPTDKSLSVPFLSISMDLIPIGKPNTIEDASYISKTAPHPDTPIDFGSNLMTVISHHGHWGAFEQPERLREVVKIDDYAKAKGNVVIVGGDFNATINEPAIQFLLGNYIVDGSKSTLWAEAQEIIYHMGGNKPYNTSFTHGPLVDQRQLFDLHRTPERRIDYLFNFGFSYGREYAFDGWSYPVNLDRARELSDHAPLIAGLLDYQTNDD